MDGLHLDQLLAAAVFTGARVSGLMLYCPFLSSDAIPAPLKAGLTLLVTALLHPLHGPVPMALGGWQWAGIALGEVFVGLLLGLAANFLLEAPLLAGQILGVQMGYSLATLFDPSTQADTPVLAEFHRLAALLIFLQINVHHWLLRALARSFVYLPAGSAPATLIADAVLGFLGKASPSLPVLFIGLAVKNLLGLAVLIGVVAYWPQSFARRFADAVALGEHLLHLAR